MRIFVKIGLICGICIGLVSSHGMLIDPVNRGSRWRFDSSAPVDYNDNQGFCGGFYVQWYMHEGKCGLCGDDYGLPTPRPHELGGEYGEGVIVKSYRTNSRVSVAVLITANHLGYFLFDLCNLDIGVESEECFSNNKLSLATGEKQFSVKSSKVGWFNTTLVLPMDLECNHCVLRWTYITGNSWGKCANNTEALGCGRQENFRSCSDIAVLSDKENMLQEIPDEIPME